jgi:ParB family chromosome partitioning protein
MLKETEPVKKRTALGQGLDALLSPDNSSLPEQDKNSVKFAHVDSFLPNPYQPRRSFSEESLLDLSNSIKELGIIQPIIVRTAPEEKYEIIAGERRWRASKLAGFTSIPIIERDVTDSEALEIALIENLQRENLNPLETAEAYNTLIDKFSYTHDNLAKRMGKERSNITNHLRLLKLPDPIKDQLRQNLLSMGHARTLLAVEHLPTQMSLTNKVVKRRLSVRELEKIVQNLKNKDESKPKTTIDKDPDMVFLEKRVSAYLSTKVAISKKSNGSGKLEIHFHSGEELERLLDHLGYQEDFS